MPSIQTVEMRMDTYFNQHRLSEFLDTSERTLERWRVEGTGPAYVKAGRKVLYRRQDVEEWLARSRRISTSQKVES